MKHPNFNKENLLKKKGYKRIAGLDEAGRGPLAGPVVAAAVLVDLNCDSKELKFLKGINDSKKLSAKQRDKFYEILVNSENIKWGIGVVSEKIIDKVNILQATKLAMQKSIDDLNCKTIGGHLDYLILDGNFKIKTDIPQKSVIGGDQKVISISAASIIAKVTRDRIMCEYDKKYPQYGFSKHKGYGTKLHIKMLKECGACPIHRKTFYPVMTV